MVHYKLQHDLHLWLSKTTKNWFHIDQLLLSILYQLYLYCSNITMHTHGKRACADVSLLYLKFTVKSSFFCQIIRQVITLFLQRLIFLLGS